jgi:hypothetical protein
VKKGIVPVRRVQYAVYRARIWCKGLESFSCGLQFLHSALLFEQRVSLELDLWSWSRLRVWRKRKAQQNKRDEKEPAPEWQRASRISSA